MGGAQFGGGWRIEGHTHDATPAADGQGLADPALAAAVATTSRFDNGTRILFAVVLVAVVASPKPTRNLVANKRLLLLAVLLAIFLSRQTVNAAAQIILSVL